MKKKYGVRFGCLFSVILVSNAFAASTWWVDDDWYGKGGDGSEERPFGTIQDALDCEGFNAGDKVYVLEGVYDKGGRVAYGGGTISNRVVISKAVHIKALAGREKTFIVGAPSPKPENSFGAGTNATRCILCQPLETDEKAIVEGFTICGGRTRRYEKSEGDSDKEGGFAGGFKDYSGRGNMANSHKAWLVDCTISNCVAAAGGATRYGAMYRCLVTDCHGSTRVSAIHGTKAHSSIISYCREVSTQYGLAAQSTAVNCTFFGNRGYLEGTNSGYGITDYNCVFAGEGINEGAGETSTSTGTDTIHQLFAPAVGDYRPLPASRAANLGDAGNLEMVEVPQEVRPDGKLVDYAGVPYPSSGAIAAGALQEISPTPKCGALQFNIVNCRVNGHNAGYGAYAYSESYPAQYVLESTAANAVYSYYRMVGGTAEMVVPRMDDSVLLMPPPSSSQISTNFVAYADGEYYVDPNTGSDDNNGSKDAPWETLQHAFSKLKNKKTNVVHAAAGDYRKGGSTIKGYNSLDVTFNLFNRLCIATGEAIRFKGAGAGKSFIYGAPDPNTETGLGPDAVRALCVYSPYAIVQGFTITDSYSGDTGVAVAGLANNKYPSDDFAIHGRKENEPAHIADCIVSNCYAKHSISKYIKWQRTRFIDNISQGGLIILTSDSASCLFARNKAGSGRSCIGGNCYGVSFFDVGDEVFIPFSSTISVRASVVGRGARLLPDTQFQASVVDVTVSATRSVGAINDVVVFNDPAVNDFRLKSYSGATRCVPSPEENIAFYQDFWRHACGDVDGKPLKILPNGGFLAGAVQELADAPGELYVRALNGGIGDGERSYTDEAVVVGEGELTIQPAACNRPCVGVTVDGVTNLFDNTGLVQIKPDADGSLVLPIYSTDWYVDAENGDDDNLGFLPCLAKRTLKGALSVKGLASGDTVHAAAGTYADGVMTNTAGNRMRSRAVVPAGVTLMGAGAGETFILGEADPADPDVNDGCGSNAVRCVALNRYATVKGFTLSGGRSFYIAGGKTKLDNMGGGVAAVGVNYDTTQLDRNVIDCIISNNIAYRAGGASYVTLRRCLVTKNKGLDSSGNASGTYYCAHYSSIVSEQLAQYNVMYPISVCECTIYPSADSSDRTYSFYSVYNSPACEIRNSLIFGRWQNEQADTIAINTFFTESGNSKTHGNAVGPGSQIEEFGKLALGDDYRPLIGANLAIGEGDPSLLGAEDLAADFSGGQRLHNGGRLDAGALQADWRGRYADGISGKTRFTVTAVSPEAEETEGAVRLPEGAVLDASWANAGQSFRNYTVTVRVADGSAAAIRLNGEEFAVCDTAGEHTFRFANALAVNALSFACTAGSVEILSANQWKGLAISIR